MQYYKSVTDDNGYIYSCDNIRLEFNLKSNSDLLLGISQFCIKYCDKYYVSHKTFDYKYIFTFSLDSKNTFSVLVGLNSFGKLKSVVVVDFNPNKCMDKEKFKNFMLFLFQYVHYKFNGINMCNECFVKRYDLAVDIPCNRKNLSVYWNGRGAKRHELIQTTIDDTTEYFGERNSIGRVKIYNKSLEDVTKNGNKHEKEAYKMGNLPYYSRIEVTHNTFDTMVLYSSFPSAFTRYDAEYLDDDSLTDIDYILICACRRDTNLLRRLKSPKARRKWEKLKDYINPIPVEYDIDCLEDIIFQIICYTDVSMYGDETFEDVSKKFENEALSSYSSDSVSFDNVVFVDITDDGEHFEICEPDLTE